MLSGFPTVTLYVTWSVRIATLVFTGIFGGGLSLSGLMGLYGLGEYLPFNPQSDRHPPVEDVAHAVRGGFSEYHQKTGELYAIGSRIREQFGLSLLWVRDQRGIDIHRSYDPARVSERERDQLLTAIAEHPIMVPSEPVRIGEHYFLHISVRIVHDEDQLEDLDVAYAYEKIYIGHRRLANLFGLPQDCSRFFRVRFEREVIPYVAGALILLGLALVFFSISSVRQVSSAGPERWPDPQRPLKENRAPSSKPAGPVVSGAPARPLTHRGSEAVAAKAPETEQSSIRQAYEFEQERWNLPGFQSVVSPVRRRLLPEHIHFPARHFARGEHGDSHDSATGSPFDFRYYRYAESPELPGAVADLESFCRSFLETLLDRLGPVDVTLFLKNRRGRFRPTMRKSGNLFVSGEALDEEPLSSAVLKRLEDNHYVVMEQGHEIFFPLPSRAGLLGAIRIRSERPLYRPEQLSDAWFEIRKYGESLYQARIHEQATVDPASTLGNGLAFEQALRYEFALKREVRYARSLCLVQFHGRSNPESMLTYGMGLRAFFGYPQRLFRIAEDVCAVLGPEIAEEELDRLMGEYLGYLRNEAPVDITVGIAILEAEVRSAHDWFRRAARALEEANETGMNLYVRYRPTAEPATFRTDEA
ncbi:MAG: GGDEF domain-containing protein [Spirochaetales bacterium]|nr:GGDEF domain-containing protein [Spirochaetales bacterium]